MQKRHGYASLSKSLPELRRSTLTRKVITTRGFGASGELTSIVFQLWKHFFPSLIRQELLPCTAHDLPWNSCLWILKAAQQPLWRH